MIKKNCIKIYVWNKQKKYYIPINGTLEDYNSNFIVTSNNKDSGKLDLQISYY